MKFKTQPAKKTGAAQPLKILVIGGTTDVTTNMFVYECGEDIIVVDCGIGYPDSDLPGVDIIIPDFSYLLNNREKVKAVFVTHAHEDHFGAIPYLLKDLNVPIYSNKLTAEFVKGRIKDRASEKLLESVSFHLISPDTEKASVGCFEVSAFRVNHSVPSSMGFAIQTPQGLILHISDFKIDWSPVLDKPIDLDIISHYGKGGVLCLLSDCLNITTEGSSKSEQTLNETFDELFEKAGNRQILVTTISSNISRMHQIISSTVKKGRKVALVGRSIKESIPIARGLGYLKFDDNVFVSDKEAKKYLPGNLVYLIAGCYGQADSALVKVARNEDKYASLEEDAMVIFSADPNPPGTQEAVDRLMDLLTLRGAEVIYSEIQENLHVSGHGTKEDVKTVASLVKPRYFVPIGGTITRMRAYRNMVEELGVEKDRVFELLDGESAVFTDMGAKKGERVEVRQVLVEGPEANEVQPAVIKDREVLSSDGVFVVIIPISRTDGSLAGKIDVVTRGFVYMKESRDLVGKAKNIVHNTLEKEKIKLDNLSSMRSVIEKEVGKLLRKETGRYPMVIVHSLMV